jgi:hypothetical protein
MARLRIKEEWKVWAALAVAFLCVAGYLYVASRPPMESGEYLWNVSKISGPDQLTLKGSGNVVEMKLIGLRIPAAHNEAAQEFLNKALKDQWVRIKPLRVEADGVKVGFVYLSGDDITARMVRLGLAEIDRTEKVFDVRGYIELEQEAKREERGLWAKSGQGAR